MALSIDSFSEINWAARSFDSRKNVPDLILFKYTIAS